MAGDQDSQHEDTMQRDAEAPAPDHPMKPDSPTEITKPSWRYIFKRSLHEFTTDECTDLAAALTYFAVLSAFPALLAVLSLLGVVGQGEATAAWMIGFLTTNAPADLVGLLADPIRQLATQGGSGLALVTGVVGAIWAASGWGMWRVKRLISFSGMPIARADSRSAPRPARVTNVDSMAALSWP